MGDPPTALSQGEPPATHLTIPKPFEQYGTFVAWQSHLIPPHSLHGREGCTFPASVPSDDTVNSKSVAGVNPGDSGVMIEYQFDPFTHTWSVEHFIA